MANYKLNRLADQLVDVKNNIEREIILTFLCDNLHILNGNFDKFKFKDYVENKVLKSIYDEG